MLISNALHRRFDELAQDDSLDIFAEKTVFMKYRFSALLIRFVCFKAYTYRYIQIFSWWGIFSQMWKIYFQPHSETWYSFSLQEISKRFEICFNGCRKYHFPPEREKQPADKYTFEIFQWICDEFWKAIFYHFRIDVIACRACRCNCMHGTFR